MLFYRNFFDTGSLNKLQTRQATVQWRSGFLFFLRDTLEEWLPHTLQTSALWLKLRPAPREWLNHDWTRKTLQFAVRRSLENYQPEHGLSSFTTHTNSMLLTILWRWVHPYAMALRELCVALTASDACAHEPNVSPSPSKCEFLVTLVSDRQCHEYLVHGVVFGRIARDAAWNAVQ
jgi:hypothetical protein